MIKILFVCLGNICRSSAAEYIMRDLLKKEGLTDKVYVESKGISSEELGNPMYPPMRRILEDKGIDCRFHRARQIDRHDYDKFDIILGMDQYNMRSLNRLFDDVNHKIKLLPLYGNLGCIDDPWYTREFERAYEEIEVSCKGLLKELEEKML